MLRRPWRLILYSVALGLIASAVALVAGHPASEIAFVWLIAAPLYAIEATVSVYRIYWSALPRSWVLRLLASVSTIASVQSAYVAVVSVVDRPPLPEYAPILALIASIPFLIAYEISSHRSRRAPAMRPPPFGADD